MSASPVKLQEQKPPRPLPEIQKDYASLCSQAGQLQYQITSAQKDLSVINETLRDLNFEAAASNKLAAEAEQAAAQASNQASPGLTQAVQEGAANA